MHLEQLRNFCLSLPAADEGMKWTNTLAFTIGLKMFCITSLEPPFRYSIKVRKDQFEELTQREAIIPAPYLARASWITVKGAGALPKAEAEKLIIQSYALIKSGLTKKIRLQLEV